MVLKDGDLRILLSLIFEQVSSDPNITIKNITHTIRKTFIPKVITRSNPHKSLNSNEMNNTYLNFKSEWLLNTQKQHN